MSKMKFTLWDVEHGSAIWVETPNGHHHWLDVGKTPDFSPSRHVNSRYGVNEIDYLIISHPDKDHIEDLPNFIDVFGSPRVLLRNKTLPQVEFVGSGEADYQKVMEELHRRFNGSVSPDELPSNPAYNGGVEYLTRYLSYGQFADGCVLVGNNTSIVSFLMYAGVLFVCPGDIEPKGWDELWSRNQYDLESFISRAHVRFLVAPHHGRKSGYSVEMMNAIQPHAVFISDKWGASETHPEYYCKPLGIQMENAQIRKCFSTKTRGRVLCEVNWNGSFSIHQYDPSLTNLQNQRFGLLAELLYNQGNK